jgi:tripartite-type tricarboxylate transporter receptor subunit TctC
VPISVLSVFQVLPLIQEGKLKALAVTDTKRTAVLPNVQTVAEAGVANYEASLLFGLIAPPGLPPAVLAKINAEVVRIINAPEMQKKLAAQGVVPIASTPAAFVEVIKSEQDKWAKVIKAANIKE